jgi:hypothetical protein
VLIYENVEIIRRCLDALVSQGDRLAIHVVENYSSATADYIQPAMLHLLGENKIEQYIQFSENVTNNAIDIVLAAGVVDVSESEYMIITDGDCLPQGEWLDAQLGILSRHPDVFCCTLQNDASHWEEGARKKLPAPSHQNDEFAEIESGMWLCMFRSREILRVVEVFRENGFRFRDGLLNQYAKYFLNKRWVAAKSASLVELTRSGFSNPNYLEKRYKLLETRHGNDHYRFWGHDVVCPYTVYTKDSAVSHEPPALRPARWEREAFDEDPVVAEIRQPGRPLSLWVDAPHRPRPGWVNLVHYGFNFRSLYDRRHDTYYVPFHRAQQIPDFGERFEQVYFYHSIARISNAHALDHLRMAHRALLPGGRVRIAVVDVEAVLRAYAQGEQAIFELFAKSLPLPAKYVGGTRLDRILSLLVDGGVMTALDREKAAILLGQAGFSNVRTVDWDPAVDPIRPELAACNVIFEADKAG